MAENKRTIAIQIELENFEEVENKVKQLVELLQEANKLTASLNEGVRTQVSQRCIRRQQIQAYRPNLKSRYVWKYGG